MPHRKDFLPPTQQGFGLLHVPSLMQVALVALSGNKSNPKSLQLKLQTDPCVAPSEQLTVPKSMVPRSGHNAKAVRYQNYKIIQYLKLYIHSKAKIFRLIVFPTYVHKSE